MPFHKVVLCAGAPTGGDVGGFGGSKTVVSKKVAGARDTLLQGQKAAVQRTGGRRTTTFSPILGGRLFSSRPDLGLMLSVERERLLVETLKQDVSRNRLLSVIEDVSNRRCL